MSFERMIRNFTFDEKIRSGLFFSDITKVRLSPESTRIQLKADPSTGEYATDDDLYIETPFLTPNRVMQWLKFEAVVTDDLNGLPANTSIGFKVKTTAGNYYWDGSAWVIAALSDWNTEAEINANLSTFPIASLGNKSIAFVVNLKTTDANATPDVKELKVLGMFDIEFLEDIIYDGVIRKLNTEFRSSSIVEIFTDGAQSSQDLISVINDGAKTGYNIKSIRSVFNLSDDPLRIKNLLDSYVAGAPRQDGFTNDPGTVIFSEPIPSGKNVEITFNYVPEIFIRTSQDFFEVPAFPSIVFENIISIKGTGLEAPEQNSIGEDYIRDKANLTAVHQFSPRQSALRFEYAAFTNLQLDQLRLVNDFNKFISNSKQVTSWGLDNKYDLKIVDELNTRNQRDIDNTDTNTATGALDVLGVLFYDKPALDVSLVGLGQVNIDMNT